VGVLLPATLVALRLHALLRFGGMFSSLVPVLWLADGKLFPKCVAKGGTLRIFRLHGIALLFVAEYLCRVSEHPAPLPFQVFARF